MTKQEKLNWITEYIHDNGWQDVYIEEFVTSYIDNCNPKNVEVMGSAKGSRTK